MMSGGLKVITPRIHTTALDEVESLASRPGYCYPEKRASGIHVGGAITGVDAEEKIVRPSRELNPASQA
jgi:hypothetical protein